MRSQVTSRVHVGQHHLHPQFGEESGVEREQGVRRQRARNADADPMDRRLRNGVPERLLQKRFRSFVRCGRCSLFENVWKRKARVAAAPDLVEQRAAILFGVKTPIDVRARAEPKERAH